MCCILRVSLCEAHCLIVVDQHLLVDVVLYKALHCPAAHIPKELARIT